MRIDQRTAEVTNEAYRAGARYQPLCEMAGCKDMRYVWRRYGLPTNSGMPRGRRPDNLEAEKVESVARLALGRHMSFTEADELARVQLDSDDTLIQAARDAYDAYMSEVM